MTYQLAQINVARLLKPIDHPQIAGFVNRLDEINALAERSVGFVWRLKDDVTNNATALNPFNDPLVIVNMSVWEDVDSLKSYVYNSSHVDVFKQRKSWFEKPTRAHMALWWVKEGYQPTALEGKERLEYFQVHGASKFAFPFSKIFNPEP